MIGCGVKTVRDDSDPQNHRTHIRRYLRPFDNLANAFIIGPCHAVLTGRSAGLRSLHIGPEPRHTAQIIHANCLVGFTPQQINTSWYLPAGLHVDPELIAYAME
jgi:hypothetical protein